MFILKNKVIKNKIEGVHSIQFIICVKAHRKSCFSDSLPIISRRTTYVFQLNLLIGVITHHSTETALLRVMNDLLLVSDDGNGTLLTLLHSDSKPAL